MFMESIIEANVFISAYHWAPSGIVYFYPGNDPTVTPITRQIVSGEKIGSTDLYVGVLDEALPDNIAHYAIANLPLSGPPPDGDTFYVTNAGAYQGLNTYMFGLSPFDENIPADDRFVYNDQAVGRNRISGYAENVPFEGNSNADALVLLRDAALNANYVQYESYLQGGDSGGPTFADMGGELVLLGTNAWTLNDNSGSGINYVGNRYAAINAYVAVHAVPEPSTWVLMVVGGLVLKWRRKVSHNLPSTM